MPKAAVTITNQTGIHMRVASFIVQQANQFECEVYLEKGTIRANCKSILGVVSLGLRCGDEVTVDTHGSDEIAALKSMKDAVGREYRVTKETM